ncbi:MAG: DUF4386 domain-containing protein [Balneolaceae bacterium]|nr:DUF4386 domain-containing protein [Balneolaceae bacterium]
MNNFQKTGAFAAFYAGLAYIVGIIGFLFMVEWADDPAQTITVMAENQISLHVLYIIVYQIWAVFLVILSLSLYQRLKNESPALMKVFAALGIIWATVVVASGMIYNVGMDAVISIHEQNPEQASTIWKAIETVCNGLGGGNEILGGFWMIIISWAALQTNAFPKVLNYLGVIIGIAGILSALPGLVDATVVFGILQIIWFIWMGIVLLRSNNKSQALTQDPETP